MLQTIPITRQVSIKILIHKWLYRTLQFHILKNFFIYCILIFKPLKTALCIAECLCTCACYAFSLLVTHALFLLLFSSYLFCNFPNSSWNYCIWMLTIAWPRPQWSHRIYCISGLWDTCRVFFLLCTCLAFRGYRVPLRSQVAASWCHFSAAVVGVVQMWKAAGVILWSIGMKRGSIKNMGE